jgi:hypothetical protein
MNYGDKEAYFKLEVKPYKDTLVYNKATIPSKTKLKVGENEIILEEPCTDIVWDSKTGLVMGQPASGGRRPIYYTG